MNAFFKGACTVLGRIWVWSLLLVLLVAMTVWFFGPLLAVDDYRFWQTSSARLLTISVLFLVWGLAMVYASWRRMARQGAPDNVELRQRKGLVDNEQRQLRRRFKDALYTLKNARVYGERSPRWRSALPWYLLIGKAGSGKTRLLAASGLQRLQDRTESTADASGTRCCDWHFAEDGVLLDTAGRYLTQPDSRVDSAGWSTLLGLLKRRSGTRPLNGVVVTLSMDTLLHGSERELESDARAVQSRLQEIRQTLHVDVPIYLVVTQADRLPGFAEFFDRPLGEGSEAVLGESVVAGKGGIEIGQVRQAFEALLQRLSGELVQRLHQERNSDLRGRMLDFPQQAARIGERLSLYIDVAFCGPRYRHANGFRGFYLTSADGGPGAPGPRAHFIQGLFSRVILAEANLAGLDSQERRRIRWRQGLLTLGALLVVGAAGLLWTRSYAFNHQRLEQLRELMRPPATVPPGSDTTLALLPLLDSRLAATRVFPVQGGARLAERMGLYQGDISRPVLEQAYGHALGQLLLSQVSEMLEEQVRGSLEDRERLLDNLRAYLMLDLKERRDASWLRERVAGYWSIRFAGEPSVQSRLNEHFARLLEQPFVQPLNTELVAQARHVLRGESLVDVVYRVLREQARSLEPYRLAQGLVFDGADRPIPGFYTRKYLRHFEEQGARLVNTIVQDNWVLGEGADLSAMDLQRLMVALEQRYFSEYADAWSEALGRIRLRETDNARQGAEQLASLASAQSPLLQMLQQVRDNTRLPSVNEHLEDLSAKLPGPATALGQVAQAATAGVRAGLAGTPPDTARRALQRRFEPLHQLLDNQQNPGAELTQALQALNDLHLQLATLNREGSPEPIAFEMVKRRIQGQQDALGNVRNVAARLPLPLTGWFEGLADEHWRRLLDQAYRHVNQRYQSEVYGFYAKAIKQRFPFNAHASSDVALNDFQEFFKPEGVMARFFDSYLKPFVSGDAGRYRLRSLDGRSLPMSRALLDQQPKVQVIRRGFFADDPGDLQVRFTLAPYSLDPAVSRAVLRLGDQQMVYRHGPIVPMTMQWPSEAENGRSSLVLERGGERPLGIEKNAGAWSMFRLFDLMQSEPSSGQDVLILKADLAGLRANYLLTSRRTPNPFQMAQWRTFRLPEQL
ncbi:MULTISPECIES: type VI secretion system membrane subunit TssM [unclassified Pseudomonas]|uniref:type VI secretion system membrane subunit TssM n=1 Tax=unclassified Pseudomonas TaxID=196821 RepID=UPI0015A21D6B|nr:MULTISPECIES: type VI secretion system membrane subunit TssM [unclassified Pseudomonas]NWC94442.1 type VI secretion system membrane subunit TssM [Pseudomonas sp. IPO3779]NWD19003.1 type VI secretion system membrane subunit TssM [Pseudomonas sp. IPO3778]